MSKHRKKFNRTLAVILSSMLIASTVIPSLHAIAEDTYPAGVNCVLVSDDNAVFNVEKATIDGNIYAHDNITFYGSEGMKVDGSAGSHGSISDNISASVRNNTKYTIPDFSAAIERNASYQKTFASNAEFSDTTLDLTQSIYADGNVTLDEVTLTGHGYITAENTIDCRSLKTQDNDYVIMYAKEGDIIISASSLTLNGVIYAPHGKVIFNVKNLTVNGGIYAEDVEFNGTELSINKTEKYNLLVMDRLVVNAGEDREIYVGETLTLEGISNYENVSYEWSSDKSVSFDNARAQTTSATFSKIGTYTVKLTGKVDNMSDSDTLTVKVNPDPSKTFTTTSDFTSGTSEGTVAKDGSLYLDTEDKTVSPIKRSYQGKGVSGINTDSTVTKDRITASSDSLDISYDLKGVGSNISAEEQGIDFVFLIDNSGSMYGAYLENAKQAAKTILSYMREGDRYAISDLGRVHLGFTDDKELIEQEINKVGNGSGSSETDDGINIVNQLFDEQSSANRQKYMIVLADGEAFDGDYSLETMRKYAQDSADRNIRIFALAMRDEMQNMQDAAIISKGIYKNCPDAETIKTFMEKLGAVIFNSAARNVLFKTTVADRSIIDFENISPAPASVTENEDGSAEIAWSFDAFEIDEEQSINIPVKSDMFPESGYERITYNTALYYNDKEGKGQKTYLDDVTLPCDTYRNTGTWSAVYDSQRPDCQWTGIYWNGVYPSDSSADIYISVSNDGINYTEEKKVVNYTSPENLTGRYIRVRAELKKGSDGSSPVIEDITVISGTMRLSEPLNYKVSAKIDTNGSVYANRPAVLYADITGSSDSVKNIEWTVGGTKDYTLDTSDQLRPVVTFLKDGNYSITLKVTDENGSISESKCNIEVMKEENVSDIIFDDGTSYAPVKYTVEGEFNYYNYYGDHARTVHLKTDNPSAIAWVSVRCIPDDEVYITRWNKVWVYHIDEELNASFNLPNYTGKMEITAYDWSGTPYTYTFDNLYDNTRPTVELIKPDSLYPNKCYYTLDPYTVKVKTEDNCELDRVELYVNDEKVELDENGSYTFTPTEAGWYTFKAIAYDKAGNSAQNYYSHHIDQDTYRPDFNPFSLNRNNASIGNEIVFTAKAFDNQTGIKSVVYTVNDEEITLDENDEYRYIANKTGEFIFKGVVVDNRDNTYERTARLVVTEDTQRPSVYITATKSGEMLVGTTATVTVTYNDNVAVTKVDIDVNGTSRKLNENNQFKLKAEEAGNIVITATAYDNAGNAGVTTYRLKAIAEDTAPPSVWFYPSSRYEYQDRIYGITVTSTDNTQVGFRNFYLDGKKLEPTERSSSTPDYRYDDYYEFNPSEIGAGEHTFKAVTKDSSGNRTELEKTFTVSDTSMPDIYFDGGYYFNTDADVVLTLKITDNTKIASVTGTLNDKPIRLKNVGEQTLTIEKAPAGTYVYSVTAKDIYGNERTSTRNVVVRDTIKPVITLSEVAEEYFIPDVPVIRMNVTDNVEVDSVTVTMNGQTLEYDGKNILLPDTLAEGTYTISIIARDTVGNSAYETVRFTVSKPKDVTPPVIEEVSIIPEHPEVGSPIQVFVTASDDSGEVNIEVSTNGIPFTYDNGAYVYTPQTVGEISILIKATDPSGNSSSLNPTGYVSQDATAPVVTADYFSTMTVNESQTITVRATDNKALATVALQMDGNYVTLSDNQYVFTPSSSGTYTFIAMAADASGNIGSQSFSIEVTEKQDEEALKQYLVNRNETATDDGIKSFIKEYNTPLKIYEFTKNNLQPQFYGGSRKGAAAVYAQGGGNDVDTASFLIAALRKLGYPARYVSGTVIYSEDELKALTGAKDTASAIDTLNASDYDSQPYYTPSGKKLLGIHHTWVEAYVPETMCGGTGEGKTWVTLDPWYKKCSLSEGTIEQKDSKDDLSYMMYQEITDTLTELEKQTGAVGNIENLRKFYSDMMAEKAAGFSYKTLKIQPTTLDSLPKSPEFTIISKDKSFADVAEEDRDQITFSIGGKELASVSTYGISSKNILLQYVPAADKDKTTFDNAEGNWKKTGMNISVVPVITADGKELGRGTAVTLGTEQSMTIAIRSAGTTKSFNDPVCAGNMYAVVTNAYDLSAKDIQTAYDKMAENAAADKAFSPYSEELLGSLLNYAGKMYYSLNDRYEEAYAAKYNMNVIPKISVGLFGYEFGTRTNFYGNVTGIKDGHFMTDIDEYTFTAVSRDGNADNRKSYILSQGAMGSYLEGYVWSFITDASGLSTMSVIAASMAQDVKLLNITADNLSDIYSASLSDEVVSDIVKHVREGYTAIVPAKEITIDDWTGTGYILVNYDTLEKNYFRLSTTINGGGESLIISLDDVMISDNKCKGGWGAEDAESPSPDDKYPMKKYDLSNGRYTVSGKLLKGDGSSVSMANEAMNTEILLTVQDKMVYLSPVFHGMKVKGKTYYISHIDYYLDGYTTDESGRPAGSYDSSTVYSYLKDSSGNPVSDEYGSSYPEKVTFPLIYDGFVTGKVPLRVTVSAMEGLDSVESANPVYLFIDWKTLRYKGKNGSKPGDDPSEEDPGSHGGHGTPDDPELGGNDGYPTYDEYYACDIDLEKLMQKVYRIRVMMATLRLQCATLAMTKSAYSISNPEGWLSTMLDTTGAASGMLSAADNADYAARSLYDARNMLMDFYFETGDQTQIVLDMMEKANAELNNWINECIVNDFLSSVEDSVKDKLVSKLPEKVQTAYNLYKLYEGISSINDSLEKLAAKSNQQQ